MSKNNGIPVNNEINNEVNNEIEMTEMMKMRIKQTADYYNKYAAPMNPKPNEEILQRDFPYVTEFGFNWKSGLSAITEALHDANHPDTEKFYSFAMGDMQGCFDDDDDDSRDGLLYLHYMIDNLVIKPNERFINFENKASWKSVNTN